MKKEGGIILVSCLLACSQCGSLRPDDCSPPPCPTSRLTAHLVSGRLGFALRGHAMETLDLAATDPITTSSPCTLGLIASFAPGDPLSRSPVVSCHTSQGEISVELGAISDPRTLTLGRHELTPEEAGLIVTTKQQCDLVARQGTTAVDVTRAEGGAVSYPSIVTSDYARDFAVHLESSYDNGCTSEALVLDLQLSQTASDYLYDPTTVCGCL